MTARRPGPRRARAAVLLGLGAVASGLGACSRPEPAVRVRYADVVSGVGLPSDTDLKRPELVTCGDLSRLAIPLTRHEPIELSLPLLDAPRLEVALCVDAEKGRAREQVAVSVTIGPRGDDHPLRARLRARRDEWTRARLDLETFARDSVDVRLALQTRGGYRVWVRDLSVRQTEAVRRAPKGVILVSLDALRADAIDGFGGRYPVTGFRRLVELGETWEHHYAASTWTKPSHATLLTGRLPWTHRAISEKAVIRAAGPTVAERFRNAGFRTAAWVHDSWLLPKFGFDRGFDEYHVARQFTAEIGRQFVEWLAADEDRPFFVFLHLMDPHSDFAAMPYEVEGRHYAEVQAEFGASLPRCPSPLCGANLLAGFNESLVELGPSERELIARLYRESADRVASDLDALWDDLSLSGVLDRSLVVLTADHGEALFEHEMAAHASLHEEVVHVPLVIKWPGNERAGTRRERASGANDVAVTMLEAVGLSAGDLGGTNLAHGDPPGPIVIGDNDWAIIDGRMKAIVNRDGSGRLFDLLRDPDERVDLLSGDRPDARTIFARLRLRGRELQAEDRRRAEAWPDDDAGAASAPLTEEEKARLKALGYL